MDEPYFYRNYFLRWVEEGLAEYKKIREAEDKFFGESGSLPRSLH